MEISSLNQAPFDRSRNSRKVVAFLVGLAFPLFCLGSGKPVLSWSSGQGTARGERVIEGIRTMDGGFLAVGRTMERVGRYSDGLVVKIDESGRLEWQRTLGRPGAMDEARCVVEASDGFIIGGSINKGGRSRPGLWKLGRSGQTKWFRTFEGEGHGAVRGLASGKAGIVATGYLGFAEAEVPFIADEATGFLLNTDAEGNLLWRRELPVSQGSKVEVDAESGRIAVCSTAWRFSGGRDHQDGCLMLFDSRGKTLWTKYYGGADMDQFFDIDPCPGGFVLAGHSRSLGGGGWDAWLVRVDKRGNMVWQRNYGQPMGGDPKLIYDECYCVKATADGGFVLACGSGIEPENVRNRKDPLNVWAAYLIRTDGKGRESWKYLFHKPHEGHNAAEWVVPYAGNAYLLLLDSDHLGSMGEENFGFLGILEKESLSPGKRP